jgi:hypothetical protein
MEWRLHRAVRMVQTGVGIVLYSDRSIRQIKPVGLSLLLALAVFLVPELKGQNSDTEASGRRDQIEQQRQEKSDNLTSIESTENAFTRIGHVVRRVPIGFRVDGLGPGAGVAADSILEWNTYGGRLLVRLRGTAWFHGFYNAGTGIEVRNFLARDLTLKLDGSHADSPQLEYYGPGPNSSIHNRTDFRREDTLFSFRAELRPHRKLAQACRIGELLLHIGPGTSESLATTQSVFGPNEAPGISVENNYVIGGCSAQADFRDLPQKPRKGTYAEASYDRYYAQDHDQFSFHRMSGLIEEYVSFLNKKRVIALRAKTDLSFHSEDQVVPFYFQPTLGSDIDLRGFRRYRFYDENSIALTGEYRWEISPGFDMALFVDGGKVFHRPGQMNLSGMESSAGFGLRFENRHTFATARLDFGFSREGFQVWLKCDRLF